MANPETPKISYWHLWTDNEGVTHQTRCELTNFEWQSMGGKAASQWNDHLLVGESSLLFCILPVGWNGDWHENPGPNGSRFVGPLVRRVDGRHPGWRWDPAMSLSAAIRTRSRMRKAEWDIAPARWGMSPVRS